MSPSVTVVIPTLNEAENLSELIRGLESVLPPEDGRIIIVDDASTDGTPELADSLNAEYGNIVTHRRGCKLGFGSAVLDGIRVGLSFPDTKFIVTMDADLSHRPEELPSLLAKAEHADVVQGSRYMPGGRIYGWPLRRRAMSLGMNIFFRLCLRTGLKENTTNYRVYSRACAETLASSLKCKGYELPVAALIAAKDAGFTVVETPITFTDRNRGKSKLGAGELVRALGFAVSILSRRLAVPWSNRPR